MFKPYYQLFYKLPGDLSYMTGKAVMIYNNIDSAERDFNRFIERVPTGAKAALLFMRPDAAPEVVCEANGLLEVAS